jgi:hypothetical protein
MDNGNLRLGNAAAKPSSGQKFFQIVHFVLIIGNSPGLKSSVCDGTGTCSFSDYADDE